MNHLDAISAQVTDTRVSGAPNRQLRFIVEVRNKTGATVAFLSSRVRVLLQNIEVADGDLLRLYTAPARGAGVPTGVTQPGEVVVPLTRESLSMIEQQRHGDVEVSFFATVRFVVVLDEPDRTLVSPRELDFEIRFASASGQNLIPQSRWIDFLKQWGHDETLLLELPYRTFGHGSSVALERWEKAVEHYRRGDWDEVLMACRRMLEARAMERTSDSAKKADMKQLRTFFESSAKGDYLDTMTTAFSNFLHLGRHEQPSGVGIQIKQADALLALSVAAAILRYTAE